MVVFNCNACGESLKKNQVEKHYLSVCRRCEVLSCVDCGKDFWGDDYKQHTKCISEEEKYSGKNYVPKPGANKGEAKQEAWLQKVQEAIDNASPGPRLKDLLERMKDYPNIPRKKAKFENFLSNSLRVYDRSLSSKVWDMLMTNVQQEKVSPEAKQESNDSKVEGAEKSHNSNTEDTINTDKHENCTSKGSACDETGNGQRLHKESKQQRKEKRKKLSDKDNEVHKTAPDEPQSSGKQKKRKSAKICGNEEEDSTENLGSDQKKPKKVKKKKKEDRIHGHCPSQTDETEAPCSTNGKQSSEAEENSDEPVVKKTKVHFDWESVIFAVLHSKSKKEISIKKLKKRVIAQYLASGASVVSEEKLGAKFAKKVKRNPGLIVTEDRVKLSEGLNT